MKPGAIVLSRPTRHYNASIDGCTIEVVAISMRDEPRLNVKHIVLEGYAYPERRVFFDLCAPHSIFPHYIDRVIFSGPMTIIFWNDGTKTKVRLAEGSFDDRANAIRWAMAKKYYRSRAKLEKLLGASRKFGDMWDDNSGVYTILMTLFGDPKKLEEYVNDALKIAENYNEK